jgi:hypothetical protein
MIFSQHARRFSQERHVQPLTNLGTGHFPMHTGLFGEAQPGSGLAKLSQTSLLLFGSSLYGP